MVDFLRWYFPWSQIDWVLRVELLLWLGAVVLAAWICYSHVLGGKHWLKLNYMRRPNERSEPDEASR